MNICIILARDGSVRIPHKNTTKEFLGKPMVDYSIELAEMMVKDYKYDEINTDLKIFDKVIVSTDSTILFNRITKNEKIIPFYRRKSESNQTMVDAINEIIAKINVQPILICCLYATAPLLKHYNIIKSYQMMQTFNFNHLIAMNGEKEAGSFFWSNIGKSYMQRQYGDQFKTYINSQDKWVNIGYYPMSDLDCIDIDTEEDWKEAERKYIALYGEK